MYVWLDPPTPHYHYVGHRTYQQGLWWSHWDPTDHQTPHPHPPPPPPHHISHNKYDRFLQVHQDLSLYHNITYIRHYIPQTYAGDDHCWCVSGYLYTYILQRLTSQTNVDDVKSAVWPPLPSPLSGDSLSLIISLIFHLVPCLAWRKYNPQMQLLYCKPVLLTAKRLLGAIHPLPIGWPIIESEYELLNVYFFLVILKCTNMQALTLLRSTFVFVLLYVANTKSLVEKLKS